MMQLIFLFIAIYSHSIYTSDSKLADIAGLGLSLVQNALGAAQLGINGLMLQHQYTEVQRITDCYQVYQPHHIKCTLQDIVGLEAAKNYLHATALLLRTALQHDIELEHVLLAGQSGIGKTMLAYATAHEAQCPLLVAQGHEFSDHGSGGSAARRMRGLFVAARRYAPCVVVIENIEIPTLSRHFYRTPDQEQTTEELAFQMSDASSQNFVDSSSLSFLRSVFGRNARPKPFLVIGTTQHIDLVDEKLLQSTRFAHIFKLSLPSKKERELLLVAQALRHNLELSSIAIAQETQSFSPAELMGIIRSVRQLSYTRQHVEQTSVVGRIIALSQSQQLEVDIEESLEETKRNKQMRQQTEKPSMYQ